MSASKIIADTTRCYRGSEQETANAIRALCTQQNVAEGDLIIIGRADQSEIRQRFQGQAKCIEVSGDVLQAPDQACQQVLSALAKIVGNRECEQVMVLSYHGRTLKAAAGFPAGGVQVSAHSFSNVRVISGRQVEQPWNFEHIAPLGDALRVLSLVLQAPWVFLESHRCQADGPANYDGV